MYVNGSATYTSNPSSPITSLSSVTVTPTTAGPWTVNVYAYNATYGLLARGYGTVGWTNKNVPQPIIYSPFSTDILNYAAGYGQPFWTIYAGTGTVAVTTTPKLLTSAGSITKTGTGTSYLAATTNYPNNTYTLPVNVNGYTISYWMNYSTTSPATVPVAMVPVPNSYTMNGTTTIGHQMNSISNALFQPKLFNTGWNSGYPITTGAWVHYVATMATTGAYKKYLASATHNILTQLTTTVTGMYIANSGIKTFVWFHPVEYVMRHLLVRIVQMYLKMEILQLPIFITFMVY